MYFQHLTMREGLSQSTVMSILQDSQGYIWLATEGGLDRYDGYSVREYRRERGNDRSLASDYIWKIAEDVRGDLWLATANGGVARWERKSDRFRQFRHDPRNSATLASDATRTLLIDKQDRVWVGTMHDGLDLIDPRTDRVRHFRHRDGDARSLAADAVFALHEDRAGRLWVGTDAGLSRYEPATDDFVSYGSTALESGLANVRIRSIHEDHEGMLWIGTLDGGLRRFDPQSGRATSFRHDPKHAGSLSNDRVQAILEDDAQRLWVGTANGLNLFDRATQRFIRYGHDADIPQSLRDDDVMSLYQDRSGVLWVGTRVGGASHWDPNSWALGHYRSALTENTAINAFADDGKDKLWVGTADGLIEIDRRTGNERRYNRNSRAALRLEDDRVMALLHDSAGTLWIGTMTGGLTRFDPQRAALRSYRYDANDPGTLPADGIMCLYEDHNGDIWVGTFGGGVARIDHASGALTRYPHSRDDDTGLNSPRASAIVEDSRGNLWIGTIGGGVNLLERRTGRFYHYRRNDRDPYGLGSDSIYALHVDRRGDLWVGTAGGGLDKVIGGSDAPREVRFQATAELNEMPSQAVYGIESDGLARLWLSTNRGLVRFDPRDGSSRLFGEPHGLQAEEFNFNAHYRGRDGMLYFGGNSGFNSFRPEAVRPAAPPQRVALTSVAIMNRTLALPELPTTTRPLELSYDDKLVTFEFAALDFSSPANNRYLYQLEGFDRVWFDAGTQHRATYTNLDAGDYVLKVRVANADSGWSEDALRVPVRVAAAPWNTMTARLAYAVACLAVSVYLLWAYRSGRRRARLRRHELEEMVRARTCELEERNQELQVLSRAKSDFVARMNHELRTPMNGVLGMSELLLDTQLSAVQHRFAEGIHRSAESLLAIVDDVLDFAKIEAGRLQLAPIECDLVELVEQTAEMLAASAAKKGIELLCDCPVQALHRVHVDVVRLRQVLVNLGGNAVKFTDSGHVMFQLELQGIEGDWLRVRFAVVDTGIGIEPENQQRIFEEFCQEDASTTRRFGGTGLGLAIARRLVELMGGRLSLDSKRAAGSTFSFELRLPLASAEARTPASGRLHGARILVTDDNPTARDLIIRALSRWHAQVAASTSISDVVCKLRTSAYDALVIDDSLLQGGDTLLLQQALVRCTPRPRVVRLASYMSLTQEPARADGWFDAVLSKPLHLRQLHDAIAGHVNAAEEVCASGRAQPPSRLQGRALIVEDQSVNRDVAKAMLSGLGLEVETAADGQQALEMLAGRRYELVLMDCRMPVMDGFTTTAAWRDREPPGMHLPIIALTADTSAAVREACLAAGMDDYLCKPFRRAALYATLARWLPGGVARDTAAAPEIATTASG